MTLTQQSAPYAHWDYVHPSSGDRLRIIPERGGLVSGWVCGGREILYLGRNNFITIHTSLHGANRIDFGNLDHHSFLSETHCRTLTNITITKHKGFPSRKQHIRATFYSIIQTMSASIFVIVLDFVTESLTFMAGTLSVPFSNISYSLNTPVVVSSEIPFIFSNISGYFSCTIAVKSPPSSKIIFASHGLSSDRMVCSIHQLNSSSFIPFQAKTGMPF